MRKLSDLLASPKPVRVSSPSDLDELLGENVDVLGQRGEVDMVTTHNGVRHYHIDGNDGQRLDNVGKGDIKVLRDGRWYQ